MVFPSPFGSTDEEALLQVSRLAQCLTMDLAEPEHKHNMLGKTGMEGFKNKRVSSQFEPVCLCRLEQGSSVAIVTERVNDGHTPVNRCFAFLSVLVAFFIGGG